MTVTTPSLQTRTRPTPPADFDHPDAHEELYRGYRIKAVNRGMCFARVWEGRTGRPVDVVATSTSREGLSECLARARRGIDGHIRLLSLR